LKLIVAMIRPERLEAVQQELAAAQVFRLTISDVQGLSPGAAGASSAAAGYAGAAAPSTTGAPTRKVKLEVAVNEDFVEATVRAITRAGRSAPEGDERSGEGSAGDGAVFVLPLEEVVRIRTGERGPDAI